MVDADFAANGFASVLPEPQKVTRYQVIGERSSGTNFVKRLLGRNTTLTPVETLGWKHGFPSMIGIPRDLMVVVVVRSAAPWALSMHAKPWHCSPDMQRLEFSDFIRARWDTYVDRPRYFDGAQDYVGQALMQDRDPLTGAQFDNLFALRRCKLAAHVSYLRRDCNAVLVRLEDAVRAPETLLGRFETVLGQSVLYEVYRPVIKRLGSKFKASVEGRPKTPDQLGPADLAFLTDHVDPAQEAALGYSYDA